MWRLSVPFILRTLTSTDQHFDSRHQDGINHSERHLTTIWAYCPNGPQRFVFVCVLANLIQTAHDKSIQTQGLLVPIQKEELWFKLWSANVGAHLAGRSSLDYRLREPPHLQRQVLSLLMDAWNSWQESCYLLERQTPPAPLAHNPAKNLAKDNLIESDTQKVSDVTGVLREGLIVITANSSPLVGLGRRKEIPFPGL